MVIIEKTYRFIILLVLVIGLSACAGNKPYKINMMPAPDVYADGTVDLFDDENPMESKSYKGILYATDRSPATEDDKARYYRNERGHVLRLGIGRISLKKHDFTWEEARRVSLLKNRTEKYPLRISGVEEIGVLSDSFNLFNNPEVLSPDPDLPARKYAALINAKLEQSENKDIYIYVPGYKVIFENPLLVATELWHFLGYDGVFIAYSWPSTPKTLAYASDLETAVYTARKLRLFLKYLARETNAERIHIVAYSAGTRVVITALNQLALENKNVDRQTIQSRLRLGHVILVGSDFDRDIFGGYMVDGFMKIPDDLSIYTSRTDKALGMSRRIFRRQRLGQDWDESTTPSTVAEYLRSNTDKLAVIDVTDAEESDAGNGHAYFRKSPWASSDILMTLKYNLRPEQRGLITNGDWPVWKFPDNYMERLRTALTQANPSLSNN